MSHWMTSGGSRLKVRRNRTFASRVQQRANFFDSCAPNGRSGPTQRSVSKRPRKYAKAGNRSSVRLLSPRKGLPIGSIGVSVASSRLQTPLHDQEQQDTIHTPSQCFPNTTRPTPDPTTQHAPIRSVASKFLQVCPRRSSLSYRVQCPNNGIDQQDHHPAQYDDGHCASHHASASHIVAEPPADGSIAASLKVRSQRSLCPRQNSHTGGLMGRQKPQFEWSGDEEQSEFTSIPSTAPPHGGFIEYMSTGDASRQAYLPHLSPARSPPLHAVRIDENWSKNGYLDASSAGSIISERTRGLKLPPRRSSAIIPLFHEASSPRSADHPPPVQVVETVRERDRGIDFAKVRGRLRGRDVWSSDSVSSISRWTFRSPQAHATRSSHSLVRDQITPTRDGVSSQPRQLPWVSGQADTETPHRSTIRPIRFFNQGQEVDIDGEPVSNRDVVLSVKKPVAIMREMLLPEETV